MWLKDWLKMELAKAIHKVTLAGQAYLYADLLRVRAEAKNEPVSDEQFHKWMDEWVEQARKEIEWLASEDN